VAKILLVIAVTVLIVVLFRGLGKGLGRRGDKSGTPQTRGIEDMVRCRVCGVNLPRSEALLSRGRFYCGEEHRGRDEAG